MQSLVGAILLEPGKTHIKHHNQAFTKYVLFGQFIFIDKERDVVFTRITKYRPSEGDVQKCLTFISNHFRYLTRLGAGLSPHLGHSGLNVVMHTDRTTRPPENIQARPVMIPGRPS